MRDMRLPAIFLICSLSPALNGCISLPREQRPLYPKEINAEKFEPEMLAQLNEHDPGLQYAISIVDAAIADNGLYAYLLVTSDPPSATLYGFARSIGRILSENDNPSRFIEVTQLDRSRVRLKDIVHGMDFHIGFRTISFAHPGNRPVRPSSPEQGVVQLCMWRTDKQLQPGRYRLRLIPLEAIGEHSDWLWKPNGGVRVNTEWLRFTRSTLSQQQMTEHLMCCNDNTNSIYCCLKDSTVV